MYVLCMLRECVWTSVKIPAHQAIRLTSGGFFFFFKNVYFRTRFEVVRYTFDTRRLG